MPDLDHLTQELRRRPRAERSDALAEFMELAEDAALRTGVLGACLDLMTEGVVEGQDLTPYVPALLSIWEDVYEQARPLQQSANKLEWMIDADYSLIRGAAELLLDLMGYLPSRQVDESLREGLSLTDPRLKLFAALSLLRNLEPVDVSELDKIAASHEVRIVLWEQLRKLEMESLMPERWSTPEQLAASEFSRWVSHPMELGVPPEEIELMGTFPVRTGGGTDDVCLFRFREFPKPWEPGEGWMAGIAGPFRDGEAIGSSWSSFERWDSRAAEHRA
jgi:hypothetical protein